MEVNFQSIETLEVKINQNVVSRGNNSQNETL
jgi:hypothetical protein